MAYLEIDYAWPIGLLLGGLGGVVAVRLLAAWAAGRSRRRTLALLARYGLAEGPGADGAPPGD